jgi:hypothetical protein
LILSRLGTPYCADNAGNTVTSPGSGEGDGQDNPWYRHSPSPDHDNNGVMMKKEKGAVDGLQLVHLPPVLVHHCDVSNRPKLVTATSLGTLEEKDESSAMCDDNSAQNYSSV